MSIKQQLLFVYKTMLGLNTFRAVVKVDEPIRRTVVPICRQCVQRDFWLCPFWWYGPFCYHDGVGSRCRTRTCSSRASSWGVVVADSVHVATAPWSTPVRSASRFRHCDRCCRHPRWHRRRWCRHAADNIGGSQPCLAWNHLDCWRRSRDARRSSWDSTVTWDRRDFWTCAWNRCCCWHDPCKWAHWHPLALVMWGDKCGNACRESGQTFTYPSRRAAVRSSSHLRPPRP